MNAALGGESGVSARACVRGKGRKRFRCERSSAAHGEAANKGNGGHEGVSCGGFSATRALICSEYVRHYRVNCGDS